MEQTGSSSHTRDYMGTPIRQMLSKSAFPSKTPQKYLTRQLRSLKILIAKV